MMNRTRSLIFLFSWLCLSPDALLALERYGTSKIYTDQDLFAITSLGFRGEALPSIASVSRMTIESRDEESEAGTRIEIEGGKIRSVSDTGAPRGTQISVKQLFFNTPARRKFLKAPGTEMGHVADTLSSMALAWPQVHFRLVHNEKQVKNWPAAGDPANRRCDRARQRIRPAPRHPTFPRGFSAPGRGSGKGVRPNRIDRQEIRLIAE